MLSKRLWIAAGGFLLLLVIGVGGFLIWASSPSAALPKALTSLESDSLVSVQVDPWLVFEPRIQEPVTGLIFYPGGLVDPRAYAPQARDIAEAGYLVVIPPMPLNLAVFNLNAAAKIILAYPEIQHWAVGGHSLGGSMAAAFSHQNLDLVKGLVLWASYPAESSDLSNTNLAVVSIYGSLDGLATPEKVLAARSLLPVDTVWAAIEGGNHAQFGWYGAQNGDNPAAISPEEQQAQVVALTAALLRQIDR